MTLKRIQACGPRQMVLFYPLWVLPFLFFLSNIFQQLYNTSDVMIVGRFLGQKSLAAVGATSAYLIWSLDLLSVLEMGWGLLSREIMEPKRRPITKISRRNCYYWLHSQSLRDLHWSCRTFPCSIFGDHQQLCLSLISISLLLLMVWLWPLPIILCRTSSSGWR